MKLAVVLKLAPSTPTATPIQHVFLPLYRLQQPALTPNKSTRATAEKTMFRYGETERLCAHVTAYYKSHVKNKKPLRLFRKAYAGIGLRSWWLKENDAVDLNLLSMPIGG
jgi:hypothetical protein